jgi:hypothetical protein
MKKRVIAWWDEPTGNAHYVTLVMAIKNYEDRQWWFAMENGTLIPSAKLSDFRLIP